MGDDHGVARPLRADARRNRERVLQVAREAMSGGGLTVSFHEIARRAGVGVGIVHRHFPTKEALVEAVTLARAADLVADAHALATAEDAGAAFFGWFRLVAERASADQALRDLLDGAGTRLEGDLVAALGPLLARAQRVGAVRADLAPEDVRDLLRGCLAAERWARGRGRAGRLTETICDGMRPRPS